MKPLTGVISEAFLLVVLLAASRTVPPGVLFGLYVVVVQLLSTYLIHCPAHYVVGTIGGIKFREIRLGRTSLVQALPARLGKVASAMPILTLSTEKRTLSRASRRRAAAMFAAGAVASTSSPLLIAAALTLTEPIAYSILAWIIAFAYLSFNVIFSPKAGDLRRAREVLKSSRQSSQSTTTSAPPTM